ncbi:ROK family protein [Roseomonas elaeocarpi]|uniref:ROK family protein n=1 Tax=Roseomonas elaeocarpi TaxID=907779 RepID=A0ABV6JXL9_9PROT
MSSDPQPGSPSPGAPPNVIGIDLGGTQLRVALVDPAGRILRAERQRTDAQGGPEAVIGQMRAMIAALRDENTAAIGVGLPGTFDAAEGRVIHMVALPGWRDVPLAGRLRELTGLPAALENDAKVAAIGEWHAGAGQGCRSFCYVTVSTGIGGGIVVDGRLLRGLGGLAGEIGHTRIAETSEPCNCGQRGCWEALASGTALGRRARAAVAAEPACHLAAVAGDAPATGEHAGRAAREGCAVAARVLEEEAVLLGVGFRNLHHLYAPERIVVGGGVSALLEEMRPTIERTLREQLLPGFRPAEILRAALGDDAGLVGAAGVAREVLARRD